MVIPELVNNFQTTPFLFFILSPLRQFIGGLVLRNISEKVYKYFRPRENTKILIHPLIILFYSLLPDIDYFLGIMHRGFTHSFSFALLVGLITVVFVKFKKLKGNLFLYFLFSFSIVVSHFLVDLFIEGGDPVKLFWPYSKGFQIFYESYVIGYVFTFLGLIYLICYYRKLFEKVSSKFKCSASKKK